MKRYLQDERMSQIIVYGPCFESSGLVSEKLEFKEQIAEILIKIDELLRLIKADKNDLRRIQIWLDDIKNFKDLNPLYEKWLRGFAKPLRACVGSKLVPPYKIEMQIFGYFS